MKPLKKVGKDDPRGWEEPQDASFPIIPEPENDNELPVPYYDSDDLGCVDSDGEDDEGDESDYTGYNSDVSTSTAGSTRFVRPFPNLGNFKTHVVAETDFVDE